MHLGRLNTPAFCACLLLMLAAYSHASLAAAKHPRNTAAFYIQAYGELSPQSDAQVAEAFRVFQRVREVADRTRKRTPRLVVVNSEGNPWAIALPDGHIVLSRQAIRICNELPGKVAPCLAFVLGHELAHLANDDFWHQEVHGFLASSPGSTALASLLGDQPRTQERELAADDKGYVYAAMAGYAVDRLLQTKPSEPGFFDFWMRQANASPEPKSQRSRARTTVLRERLRKIQEKLVFFEFGVRLSHFDYCDDAVYFFTEFQQVFPSREVLNNIGYCYLQIARQAMAPTIADFYWMPLQLDGATRARALVMRGGSGPKSLKEADMTDARPSLIRAREYLEQAVTADPSYVPARINLAVAYLYLGMPHQARARLVEARELTPGRPDLRVLESLAIYEQGDADADLWPAAINRLRGSGDVDGNDPATLFNLARLYDLRDRHDEARKHWLRLARAADTLPRPIKDIVCQRQAATDQAPCRHGRAESQAAEAWHWPLAVTGLQRLSSQDLRERLADWEPRSIDWVRGDLRGHIYTHPGQTAQILELDDFIQMQVMSGSNLAPIDELQDHCPRPLRKRRVPQGLLTTCDDWAALVSNDQGVTELWWAAR